MSRLDSMMGEDLVQLYKSCIERDDGTVEVVGYAYGLPWVAQALFMGDIVFPTPEEAKAWWEKEFGS